jgi:hypothetical protein
VPSQLLGFHLSHAVVHTREKWRWHSCSGYACPGQGLGSNTLMGSFSTPVGILGASGLGPAGSSSACMCNAPACVVHSLLSTRAAKVLIGKKRWRQAETVFTASQEREGRTGLAPRAIAMASASCTLRMLMTARVRTARLVVTRTFD